MAEDAAFVWDSGKAAQPDPAARRGTVDTAVPAEVQWVTLAEAAAAVGIARATIRRWAAKGRVPTRLADTAQGVRRMVGLAEVEACAAARSRPQDRKAPAATTAPVPDDHMLVPRDAWDKVLAQLGNLHEAGQQLAEARERAAKAETEAAFLRERLAEIREHASAPEESAPPAEQLTGAEPRPRPRWRRLLRRS